MLIGQMLQAAGLNFVRASGRHNADGTHIDEVVCATPSDAAAIEAWGRREGHFVKTRIASADEVAAWEKLQGEF
jgi:hypothetical protein